MVCTDIAIQAGMTDKSLSTKLFDGDDCHKNHPKSPNEVNDLLSTVLPTDEHAKIDLKKQINSSVLKFRWNKSSRSAAVGDSSEVLGRAQTHDGIKQDVLSSNSSCKDVWSMSISGSRTEDANAQGETDGWPSWGTVSNQSKGDPSNSKSWTSQNLGNETSKACGWSSWTKTMTDCSEHFNIKTISEGVCNDLKGWAATKDCVSKRCVDGWSKFAPENHEGNEGNVEHCATLDHRNHMRYRQHPYSSTMSYERGWKDFEAHSTKRQSSGWCEYFSGHDLDGWKQSDNSTCVNQVSSSKSSCWEDENMKVTSGCPRWDEAASKESSRCLNTPTRKDVWNESQEWTVRECVYSNDESDCKKPDFNPSDDTWIQHTTIMPPKCDWKKSESLIASKGCDSDDKRNHKRWWQQTSSSSMPSEKDWTDREDRNAKRQNSGWGVSFADKNIDGLRKSSSNPCSVDQGSSSMSAHWEVGETKETGGWPSWDGAVSQKTWQPRGVNRKIGWNESRGLNTLELSDSCNENSYRKPNLDGSGEFSPKCYWKKSANWTASKGYSTAKDRRECNKWRQCTSSSFRSPIRDWKCFNGRRENGHSSGWDEPFILKDPDVWRKVKPKTCFDNHGRSRKYGQWKDEGTKKATNRWSRWDDDASQKNRQFPCFPGRKGNSNVSLGWAASESGDFGEDVCRDPDIVQRGDPWIQHSLKLPPSCDWKNFSSFTASNGDYFDRDCKKSAPCLDQNGRAPTKQLSPTSSLNSSWCKPESCAIAESKISFTEKMECSPAPDLTGRLPEVARKTLHRSRSRIPSPVWKHRQHSWDQRDKRAGAAPSRDCLPRSRRGIQFKHRCGDSFRGYSHEDTAEIVENKGVQYLRRYSDHVYENPHGHKDDLQDTLHRIGLDANEPMHDKSSHGFLKERYSKGSNTAYNSYDADTNDFKEHGAVEDDKSVGKWDPIVSNAKFLSFNDLKFRETTVDRLACSNSISDTDGFRNETIKSMTKTTDLIADEDEWKSQNHATPDSTIQLSENMQLNSQFPCPQTSISHGSKRNDQVQNRQQAALSSEDSSKKNKDVNYTSPSKRLVPEPMVGEPNDAYHNMTTNLAKLHSENQEAKQAMAGNDLASDLCGIMSHPSNKNLKNAHPETLVVQANAEDKDSKDEKALGNHGDTKGGLDDKVRVFKFALAEFVKEIIKPFWKEGRLSKEAHKIVVKKVVDKVIGVLSTNIPVTDESIKLYLSFSKDKLTKLAQAYLEKVVNT